MRAPRTARSRWPAAVTWVGMPRNPAAHGNNTVSRLLDCVVDCTLGGAIVELSWDATVARPTVAGEEASLSCDCEGDGALAWARQHIKPISSLPNCLLIVLLLSTAGLLLFAQHCRVARAILKRQEGGFRGGA